MEIKTQIMDPAQMARSLARITHEIIEKNGGLDDVCLIGIKSRGIPMAWRLAENAYHFEGVEIPVGYVDISLYRDDLSEIIEVPEASGSQFPTEVTGKTIILVDDVIFTGRTARAAIEAVFAQGRPKKLQLAVLIDRGHRELPIKPDYVGKNVPTSHDEFVRVQVSEVDGTDSVLICSINEEPEETVASAE